MSIRLHPTSPERRRLAAVAQGQEPADLVVAGGRLVDVFTEEVLDGWGVAVAAGRVAYVGPDAETRAGSQTEVVDARGSLVSPGLIEAHTHLMRLRLSDFADLQLAAGVTSSVVESTEVGFVAGPRGVTEQLAAARAMPGRIFMTVPGGLINFDPEYEARVAPPAEWTRLLDEPGAIGVGELYWAEVLRGHERSDSLIEAALERGLAVEGHGAGARPAAVQALAALGAGSDHEAISAEDLLGRLRAGLYGMARHGATRQDLPALAAIWGDARVSAARLTLCTDGVEPEDHLAGRSLNAVVELAVALGLPVAGAVRLASLNVAEHFGLGRWLGGLGPGMLADLVLWPSEGPLRPSLVLVGGRRPGPAQPHTYPDWMRELALPGYDPALLEHPGPGRWRAIELVAPTVTREGETDGSDAVVASLLDRDGRRGFRGLLKGFGIRGGGVALSSGWESTGYVVVGDRPADLALAVARVRELGGGAAVAAGGRLLAEWRAPVAGLYSEAPAVEVLAEVTAVNNAVRELGGQTPNPLLTLETLTTAAIPHLRLWAGGYYRLRDGARLGLELD